MVTNRDCSLRGPSKSFKQWLLIPFVFVEPFIINFFSSFPEHLLNYFLHIQPLAVYSGLSNRSPDDNINFPFTRLRMPSLDSIPDSGEEPGGNSIAYRTLAAVTPRREIHSTDDFLYTIAERKLEPFHFSSTRCNLLSKKKVEDVPSDERENQFSRQEKLFPVSNSITVLCSPFAWREG